MKKKLALGISILLLVFSLTACGATAPKKVADSFLQAVKNKDKDALSASYVSDTFDVLTEIKKSQDGKDAEKEDNALTKALENDFVPKILDFDYTIDNEKIDGEKATVDVHFKTYQLGAAFTEFYSEYLAQAMTLVFSNPSEDQLEAIAANLITSKANSLTEKTYEKTVPLTLIKKEDKWVVDDINGENNKQVLNALSGGLSDAILNMNKAFSK